MQARFGGECSETCRSNAARRWALSLHVFSRIDGITRENCLLVGDSLSSDIRGANNYGLPCCWYNPKGTARPEGLRIDYEIRDLRQLYDLV